MKKVILDSLNTLDSVEWQHKGYTVFLNYGPGNGEKYFICRPDQEKAELDMAIKQRKHEQEMALRDAKAALEFRENSDR